MKKLAQIARIAAQPGGLTALRTWKPFSITAFTMLRSMKSQGLHFQTIIDGGANAGQFARAATETYPEAQGISFEPLPEVAETLRANLKNRPQWKVIQAALGGHDGKLSFHRNAYSLASSALNVHANQTTSFPQVKEVESFEVDVLRLDTALKDEPLKAPCLLKLDLQGFELEALKEAPCTLERCEYVLIETAFKPMYEGEALFDDIYAFMRQAGFSFLRPIDTLADATGEIVQIDALFRRNG